MRSTLGLSARIAAFGAAALVLAGSVAYATGVSSNPAPSFRQDKPAEGGTITGVVKDQNGNPLTEQLVRLMKPENGGGSGGATGGGGAVIRSLGLPVPAEFGSPGGGGGPGKMVAHTNSDAQGKFEFKNVAPGTYNIISSKSGVGFGKLLGVVVKAKETTTVELKFQ
jgi:hypothetical protein